MPVRKYRPTSPGRRHGSVADFSELTAREPYRPLTEAMRKTGGRNNVGRISMRHIGGGHRRRYRIIDFRRDKDGVPARVETIEYDPNRSARIALLKYADGERRYILAPQGLRVGDTVESGEKVEPKVGNAMPIKCIPTGTAIHNIELTPGHGGQIVRAAGTSAQLMAKEGNYAVLLLPSGEIRKVHVKCRATIGAVSNPDHNLVQLGKAGRSRWLGIRPTVRGSAQNPVSHPMGGGEGRRAGGRHPVSKWGKPAKGGKTRRPRKPSDKWILRFRRVGRFQQTRKAPRR
jgi:large subunit ribosomal protein L2